MEEKQYFSESQQTALAKLALISSILERYGLLARARSDGEGLPMIWEVAKERPLRWKEAQQLPSMYRIPVVGTGFLVAFGILDFFHEGDVSTEFYLCMANDEDLVDPMPFVSYENGRWTAGVDTVEEGAAGSKIHTIAREIGLPIQKTEIDERRALVYIERIAAHVQKMILTTS